MSLFVDTSRDPTYRFPGVTDFPSIRVRFPRLTNHRNWELVFFSDKKYPTSAFGFILRVRLLGSICVEVANAAN